MGGDGGVIASNRLYLRGAGTASHTADRNIKGKKSKEEELREQQEAMQTCKLTGLSLHTSTQKGGVILVACPYGRLYNKEAAVEALLRRRDNRNHTKSPNNNHNDDDDDDIGWHVRGLKDLYPVRFHYNDRVGRGGGKTERMPTCPVTGEELNGGQPMFLIVPKQTKKKKKKSPFSEEEKDPDAVNVLSDRALREVGTEGLQTEYGPFQKNDLLRLIPSSRELNDITKKWKLRTKEEHEQKMSSKKGDKKTEKKSKKRKELQSLDDGTRDSTSKKNCSSTACTTTTNAISSSSNSTINNAANLARTNVASAVASNAALSNLFAKNKNCKSLPMSNKEKNDNLFAR